MALDFERYASEIERGRLKAAGDGRHGPDNLVAMASTVSTNALARSMAADLESEGLEIKPLLLLAFEQTGGRGRQGRSWSSPAGRGVYATLVKPYIAAELLPTLPLLVGVGLCRALTPHLPAGCRLKWPNDLLVPAAAEEAWERPGADLEAVGRRGRKIGGILIEALVHPDGCVALIGFGVNHGHRPADLPPGATSLLLENGADATDRADRGAAGEVISLADLTWELVAGVERELEHAGDREYAVEAYRELSIHEVGEPMVCRVGDSETTGTFLGFDEAGRLRLGRPAEQGGDTVVSAGEVIEP